MLLLQSGGTVYASALSMLFTFAGIGLSGVSGIGSLGWFLYSLKVARVLARKKQFIQASSNSNNKDFQMQNVWECEEEKTRLLCETTGKLQESEEKRKVSEAEMQVQCLFKIKAK
jgi:hypothetical protein